MNDVVIIGCGVVGAACAYELSKFSLSVTVLEKSSDISNGTTKANTAIIHAGYDPMPETRMARLNVEGNKRMGKLCEKLDVPFKRIGSHVIALSEHDLDTLQELYLRGLRNGVPGMQILSKQQLQNMEPNISPEALGSLWAPSAGIISPWELCIALAETAVKNGVTLMPETPVTSIEKAGETFILHTPRGRLESRYVINAAGVHSGEVSSMIGADDISIEPNRGEYYLLDKSEGVRVHSTIFQCPNENGKGVVVTPTVHGNLIVGPNAVSVSEKDCTKNTSDGLEFVKTEALRSVPSLIFRDNIRNYAGIRANSDHADFLIAPSSTDPDFLNIAGIRSPGLTAAPAIALEAVEWLGTRTALKRKRSYIDTRKVIRLKNLSDAEKNEIIKKDLRYGRVICRCETITEGEIVAAIHSPIPARTVNAVKRRVSAGMGRCQGGFCRSRVVEILSRELHVRPEEILQDEPGSYILTGETKGGVNR